MITILTPTYNRVDDLKRLYNSLKNQKSKEFEWLIIDDGSVDETAKFISKIKESSQFTIIYQYKENGGKPSAQNLGVKLCKNDFILFVDSDDILTNDAIEILNKKTKIIEKKDDVSGIIGNKGLIGTKEIVGKKIPDIEYTTGLFLYQKLNFTGDTLRLYKTSILKKNLFPEIKNEKFIPENVVYDKIDLEYKMLVIKEVLYLCEYQEDGLSKNINAIRKNNPIGYSLGLKSFAETALCLNKKINWTILYIIWCRRFSINGYKNFNKKIRYIILYPIAFFFDIIKQPKFFFKSIDGE